MEDVRQLIHVPILHAPADMGSLAEDLAAAYIERFGRRHWDEYLVLIENFWPTVRTNLEQLGLDYQRVDLYQDGLPVCGREREIVEKAAAAGSENHQLLLELTARGATLLGTEDPRLLLEEYRNVQAALKSNPGAAGVVEPSRQDAQHGETLAKRDAYVGRRVSQTLQPGRTGLLFLGLMHNVESFLPADIVRRRLMPRIVGPKDKTP